MRGCVEGLEQPRRVVEQLARICSECLRAFAGQVALGPRSARARGRRNALRTYVRSVGCPVCLKEFWQR
eukprot:9709704-Lingulodinium_polyedra.AAC.1